MFIVLASISEDPIVSPVLERIASAVEKQLYQHYAPFWQADGMSVRVVSADDPIMGQQDACPVIVYDEPDQPNALGYHSLQARAQCFGKIFWSPIKDSGGTLIDGANSLSVTISHEALEAIGDPYVNSWVDMDAETQESVELCDRVEADCYLIDGVPVSDFLGPRAFRDGPGPYDWMNLLTTPWEIRPGGYVIRRKGQNVVNVYGAGYPDYRKMLKTSPDSRLAKRQALLSNLT